MSPNVDSLYKKYIPTYYKIQRQKADEPIINTAFTTITTNVKTRLHKDEGFGNLIVQKTVNMKEVKHVSGIGVDVRQNDILNVHEWHANCL